MLSIKKKIAMALTTTALGAMLVGAGTFALFTSTATNTGNSFAAGTVTIGLTGNDTVNGKYFEVTNMAPGDKGVKPITINNAGSLDAKVDIQAPVISSGLPLVIKFYEDEAKTTEIVPASTNNMLITSGTSKTIYCEYELPIGTGNEYQGGTATVDLSFYAEQARNN